MKRLALLLLPVLTLSACNSSNVPTKPTGKQVSKEEFIEAAKNAKKPKEDEYIKQIEISGSYSLEIYNTSYSEDATKTTVSGTVVITNNSQGGQDYNFDNVKVKGDYPVCDPYTLAYTKGLFTDEQNKERMAYRLSSNTALAFDLYYIYNLAVSEDVFYQQMIANTFTEERTTFYTNPFEIKLDDSDGSNGYELIRYSKDGVIATDYMETSGENKTARDDERNKHIFSYRIKRSQTIKITTEKFS